MNTSAEQNLTNQTLNSEKLSDKKLSSQNYIPQKQKLFITENQQLFDKLFILVKEERRIGIEILEILAEIERRKAYSDLGYDGLFSFCVKALKYSEAQAYRRIQAMRAMNEIPEIKEKISSGTLTITTVSQIQTHLRQ